MQNHIDYNQNINETTWDIQRNELSERGRSSSPEMCSVKTEFLKISKNSSEKHLCKSLFFNWRPATLLKKDFETGAFLWTLRNFWDHLFSPLGECFWRQKNRVLSGRYDPVYDPVSPDTVDELITEMYGQLPFISGNVLANSVYIGK